MAVYRRRAKRPHQEIERLRENLKTFDGACRPDPHRLDDLRRRDRPQQRFGPSGGYASQAYYQSMLGSQPMTAAQQAYANQEDQLRLLGFLSELGGDIPLGQIFYHIAYGITPPLPPPALDLASGGSDLNPPPITPSGLVTGASDVGYTGAGLTPTTPVNTGVGPATAVPEASTWVMMLIGFAGLGLAVYRPTRRRAAGLTG